MIYQLLNSFFIGSFLTTVLAIRYPQEFSVIVTDITFNAIYLYSKIQIYVKKLNKKMDNFIDETPSLLHVKKYLSSIFTVNHVLESKFVKNGEFLCLKDASESEFALFSSLCNKTHCVNKKIVFDLDKLDTTFECSDIKFMLVEINVGGKQYKVDLKTNDYNFYLVDNKFTRQFFIYYLKQHLHIKEPINYKEFKVKIIDHDANLLNFDFSSELYKNKCIVLNKTGYNVAMNDK